MSQHVRIHLWDAVGRPAHWESLKVLAQACLAAKLMVEWLRSNRHQSAVILFFVAGDKEIVDVCMALNAAEVLRDVPWAWELFTLSGSTTNEDIHHIRRRLAKQNCRPGWPAIFLPCTGGIGEDAWTPDANGVIDLSLIHI